MSAIFASDPEPSTRAVGILGLIFFGGGGLCYLVADQIQHRGPSSEEGTVGVDGVAVPAQIFRLHPAKKIVAIIFGFLLIASGILMVVWADVLGEGTSRHNPTFVRVIGVALTGLFAWFTLRAIPRVRRETYVALTEAGIAARTLDADVFVPWEAIDTVGIRKKHGAVMIGLDIGNAELVKGQGDASMTINRRMMGADILFPGNMLTGRPADLLVAIRERLAARARTS